MNAEREAEIRETIRLMRVRLAEFNVTQPATRLSLAMAEDLLAALDEAREALEEQEADMHARIRAGYDRTVADAWRKKVEEVEDQRNALRSEVDKLRHERRMFRRRIAECLPWVGCTPYPNTRHFDEMIACRDLAKDTLEEVPE
jgi:DNA repair exonuclease SbcCD ATPase subunit